MDQDQIASLIQAHAWVAIAAIVIGAIVRLLKSDVPWSPTIDARWRPIAALVLGIVAGVLNKVASGSQWLPAIAGGVVAGVVAMSSHDVIVEGIFGGKEPPVPGAKGGGATVILALALAVGIDACGGQFDAGDGAVLANHGAVLAHCQDVGDRADAGMHLKAYDACLHEAGVK